MPRAASFYTVAIATAIAISPIRAQISTGPTPPPFATAEHESWFVSGAPISLDGTVYYPSGPIVHFNRSEMLPTGVFEHIPIYSRTTQEPGSIVYVPLPGGLMKPYERRRAGDLAGTTGSTAPGFPIVLPAEQAMNPTIAYEQAAGRIAVPREVATAAFMYGSVATAPESALGTGEAPEAVGTRGSLARSRSTEPSPGSYAAPPRGALRTARRPVGLNGVFIAFEGTRWFAAGPAIELEADKFSRTGDYAGFPVYRRQGEEGVVYVPVTPDAPGLVVPYSTR
jgi:hypothetical protein